MAICKNLTITDTSPCQPPNGIQRYCGTDNKTIYVWNQVACRYDSQICSTGHCANGYCDAPPMYNACIGGYCNQQVCPESGCPANQCTNIGQVCTATVEIRNHSIGYGYVNVYRNGTFVDNSKIRMYFDFNMGDTFKFEAVGESGKVFDKFCDVNNNCVTTNPLSGRITEATGVVNVYFKQALPTLNQISIPSTKSVIKNNSVIITAICNDTSGVGMTCPTLTWNKSNNNVDIVPWNNNIDLTIIGVNTGTCTITVAGGGKTSNNCIVTITESSGTLNQIAITPSIPIVKGTTGSVSTSCKDTLGYNMTCPTLTWTSSNTSIATVIGGMITGVNVGICTVKATGGGKTSNDCIVSITSPGCTNPKYKCSGTTCISDNCDGTGTFPDANCGTGCGGGISTWYCDTSTKICSLQAGSGGYSTKTLCDAACSSGGVEVCPADQTKDASGNCVCIDSKNQYLIFGKCYKKNDVIMVAGAVVLLMMLKR